MLEFTIEAKLMSITVIMDAILTLCLFWRSSADPDVMYLTLPVFHGLTLSSLLHNQVLGSFSPAYGATMSCEILTFVSK